MTVSISGVGIVVPTVATWTELAERDERPAVQAGWFDPASHLGRRGWKYLTPATRYLLAAAYRALDRGPGDQPPAGHRPEAVGVCTGTQRAITALHARLDRTLREEGAGGLSPAGLPGFSANIPASQLTIATVCRAFSVTLTNPVVAGLEALLFGMAAIRTGRAVRVLATATEEAGPAGGSPGAVALVLDRDGDQEPGTVLGGLSRFVPMVRGRPERRALAAAVHRTVALADAHGITRYAWCGPDGAEALDAAIRSGLAGAGRELTACRYLGADGRFGAVSGLLQVAGVLSRPGPALVVAASGTGHLVAAAVASRR